LERYAYNPWGVRRNPIDWTQTDTRTHWLLNRGYTGHEHLDAFQIINMNGRVYDPLTAVFFSPDPFVSSPGEWLSYNRYGYCLNNPFKYTDPDGNFIAPAVGAIIDAFILSTGAEFVMSMYTASMAFDAGKDFWSSFGQTYISGVVTSLAFSAIPLGIGDAFGHNPENFSLVREFARAGAHGLDGGLISYTQGGDFWQGFAAGAVSSVVGTALQGKVNDGTLPFITGLAGGATGGVSFENREIGWSWDDALNGLGIGYAVGALNHGLTKYENGETYYELNEAVVTGERTVGGRPLSYWKRISGSLNNVYPEFDILTIVSGMFNMTAKGVVKATKKYNNISSCFQSRIR
jgi:RHS repeat-associated protein